MPIADRIKHAWNAFVGLETRNDFNYSNGPITYGGDRPDRTRMMFGNERSIISSIYNRLAIDSAALDILHVRLDDDKRYLGDIDSGLNNCLTVEANIDQAARAFRQDVVMTMFDRGVVALVPVDTTINPNASGSFDIQTMRVGYVVGWHPQHVRVEVFNENEGKRQEVTLDKKFVAIVENPHYTVMNEPNSTLQRLIRKLNLLDSMDEKLNSGKLDMIIQLPYVIKSEARRVDANRRRTELEDQLRGSQHGIAYTDGTEKIIQLNRPVENNLLKQVEWLTAQLYSQLGLTPEVMNGTADEATMKNYYNRTIEPIIQAIVEETKRKFLTKTARSQKQSIMAFRDPFKMVPISEIAEIADKLSRNEIVTANEMRQFMGIKPASDPKADMLVNSNMPQSGDGTANPLPPIKAEVVDDTGGGVIQPVTSGRPLRQITAGSVGVSKSTTK
jgi:portal protein